MKTLVLNASMEPLNSISPERAIGLLFSDRVSVLKEYEEEFRSPSQSIKIPAVVMLKEYVPVKRRSFEIVTRRAVFVRDDFTCQYCGGKADNIDHVIPRARGGKNSWDNVVAACLRCNRKKADKLPEQANMFPMCGTPTKPHRYAYFQAQDKNEYWAEFLGG